MHSGLATDLHAPLRIAIDKLDLARLELPSAAIGEPLTINDRTVYVGALTGGIRAFSLVPYVFTDLKNAQRIVGLGDAYTFIVLDLKDPSCGADVAAFVNSRSDLAGHTRGEFERMTADYWVARSGIGQTLQFAALLSFAVGLVVVGQVLFALTESRLRELATLKAMGAGSSTLLSYVAWQASVLAAGGSALGTGLAFLARRGMESTGIAVVLSTEVLIVGLGAIVMMCALASIASGRKILSIPPTEVFR
jgi:putative ABC transport system permease protein